MNAAAAHAPSFPIVAFAPSHLDRRAGRTLRRAVRDAVRRSPRVVVDLACLTRIDAAGVGELLAVLRETLAQGGDVKACGAPKGVLAFLKLVGADRVLDLCATVDEAAAAFDREQSAEPAHDSRRAAPGHVARPAWAIA